MSFDAEPGKLFKYNEARGVDAFCHAFSLKEIHLHLSLHLNLFMRQPFNSKERSFTLPGYGSKTVVPHKEKQCAVNCSNTVWYLLVYIFESHWRFVKFWPATGQRGKHNWQPINFGMIFLNSSNLVLSLQLTPVIDNGNLSQLLTLISTVGEKKGNWNNNKPAHSCTRQIFFKKAKIFLHH